MIWIVDGTRLKRDFARFQEGMSRFQRTNMQGVFHVSFPNGCFPANWLKSKVPVLFDFKGNEVIETSKDVKNYLYCILPQIKDNEVTVGVLTREFCIRDILNGGKWFRYQG